MIQPNVYWTLNTPFATIVGLYTNVPEGGVVHADQAAWFEGELAAAPTDRALIVALHHPLNSLDTYHSGSKTMTKLIADATAKTKRLPSMLCSGHVHNYQRFTVADAHGHGVTPHIVAGQGGYHNLHKVAKVNGQPIVTPYVAPNDPGVTLGKLLRRPVRLHAARDLGRTDRPVDLHRAAGAGIVAARAEAVRLDALRLANESLREVTTPERWAPSGDCPLELPFRRSTGTPAAAPPATPDRPASGTSTSR